MRLGIIIKALIKSGNMNFDLNSVEEKIEITNTSIPDGSDYTVNIDIKITEKDVIKICGLLQNSDLSVKEIEKITGVGKYKINAILYRNTWTKISNKYDFSKRRRR